ncbi:hypothetical protein JQ612_19990 [Bradyrhizobium manausense]|uniref:hypothetical protein n=1 Tax=Bradyrhizobium manausense TaxID=989370 RepID=UPI001BAAF2DE|nr:hypothetical protein [Bradyrhizobium manausense]MBR0835473.1 hypothetical protein [Bradyrhizobium manausense]
MNENKAPKRFVYIDDKPDPSVAESLGQENVGVFLFPDDLTDRMEELIATIRDCSVVIVDLKLADHDSDDPSSPSILYPKDGLALKEILASVLTERVSHLDSGTDTSAVDVEPKTTAFMLYSGELDLLGGGAPAKGREHVIAKRIRAEWVMVKLPQSRPESQKDLRVLEDLADAVEAVVGITWLDASEREDILNTIAGLLALDEATEWASVAKRQIFEGRPPLQSLAEQDGVALLRWLLHLVLPYPSFLVDAAEVALLCRLQLGWGVEQLSELDSPISKLFHESSYGGILSHFLGPRWWRAGVLATLRRECGGSLQEVERLNNTLDSLYGSAVPRLHIATPVRTVDEDFRLTATAVDVEDAVRLEAEEWPPELPPPWFPLSRLADNPRVRRYVLERDIDRVRSYLSAKSDGSR